MIRTLTGRLARLALLLVAVAIGTFALMTASPVDPVDAYVGADLAVVSPEQRAQIEEQWGLDDPPLERFGSWATQMLQGNWGESAVYHQPVTDVIGSRFLASLALMAGAWILSGVLGFVLGIWAGARKGRLADRAITWWSLLVSSAPTFWVALLLLYVFAVNWQVAPVCCAGPIGVPADQVTLMERMAHLMLPMVALSLVGVGQVVLHTRQATIEVLESDHVTYARALGESPRGLIVRRVLRNAAGPAVVLQFASIGELFGGSVLAEQVFSYPGLGQAVTTAALRQDVPLLLGISLVLAVFVFVGNTIGDLVNRRLDPRAAMAQEVMA